MIVRELACILSIDTGICALSKNVALDKREHSAGTKMKDKAEMGHLSH